MISPLSFPALLTCASSLYLVLASSYVPVETTCPTGALIRDANGLSDEEETYRVARKAKADEGLKSWLLKQNSAFDTSSLPTVALAHSGGGYRALLLGAGVIQGMDARDSNVNTSGLLEGITYQTALSGGAWLLSSFAGNGYPTISHLRDKLWKDTLAQSLFDPDGAFALFAGAKVLSDIEEKKEAGFPVSLTDPWGSLLSIQLFEASDGGVAKTLSSLTSLSNFTSYGVPYPLILSLGVKLWQGEYIPGPGATTYEFSPYEFGTFDKDVSAFISTKYLGTTVSNGRAVHASSCVTNFDNLGLILGTSSNIFNEVTEYLVPDDTTDSSDTSLSVEIEEHIEELFITAADELVGKDGFALYPNPFYNYISKTGVFNADNDVSGQSTLHLVDGGEANQNNPIWPLLQPARNVSAIIVNDNSASSTYHFPNGSELQSVYTQAKSAGLTRMPFIPEVAVFLENGLNRRATFFGCNDSNVITIIYIPNVDYTYASNISTFTVQLSPSTTEKMIANGLELINQNGAAGWGTCLGCALLKKEAGALPGECEVCFKKYCYD